MYAESANRKLTDRAPKFGRNAQRLGVENTYRSTITPAPVKLRVTPENIFFKS
jgi:hypothetical protein